MPLLSLLPVLPEKEAAEGSGSGVGCGTIFWEGVSDKRESAEGSSTEAASVLRPKGLGREEWEDVVADLEAVEPLSLGGGGRVGGGVCFELALRDECLDELGGEVAPPPASPPSPMSESRKESAVMEGVGRGLVLGGLDAFSSRVSSRSAVMVMKLSAPS